MYTGAGIFVIRRTDLLTRARLGFMAIVLLVPLSGGCTHDLGALSTSDGGGVSSGGGGGLIGGGSGGGGAGVSGAAGRAGSGGTAVGGSGAGGSGAGSGAAGISGEAGRAGSGGSAAGSSGVGGGGAGSGAAGIAGAAGRAGSGGTAAGGSGAGGSGAGGSGAGGVGGAGAGGGGAGGAPATCTPSMHFCVGNTVRTCSADGTTSSLTTTCATTAFCNPATATCKTQVCRPDQPACDGAVATTCNTDGSGFTGTRTDCSAASQACLSGACDAETVDAVGANGILSQADPNLYAFSVFYVARDCTLTGVDQFLDMQASQYVRFLVYQSPTEFGDYSNRASYAVTPPLGQAYVSSGPMDVPLLGGNYYMIGVWWGSGNAEYSWDAGGTVTTSFGNSVGVALISSAGVLSDLQYPNLQENGVLRQRLYTVTP